jgi:hypothetical protein
MSRVQQIEHAVREDDDLAGAARAHCKCRDVFDAEYGHAT